MVREYKEGLLTALQLKAAALGYRNHNFSQLDEKKAIGCILSLLLEC